MSFRNIDKEERKRIRRYLQRRPGATQKELSEHFGYSVYLIKKVLESGNTQTLKSQSNNDWAKNMIKDFIIDNPDKTYSEIAERFSVSKTTVYTIAKENNIQRKRGPKTNS